MVMKYSVERLSGELEDAVLFGVLDEVVSPEVEFIRRRIESLKARRNKSRDGRIRKDLKREIDSLRETLSEMMDEE